MEDFLELGHCTKILKENVCSTKIIVGNCFKEVSNHWVETKLKILVVPYVILFIWWWYLDLFNHKNVWNSIATTFEFPSNNSFTRK